MATVAKVPRAPASGNPKTPNKSRAKKAPPPILSPSQLLNQRTIDAFLLRISKTVGHLSAAADGHALLLADERFVRVMDSLDDPMADERLQDADNEQRAVRGSTASRYTAEAHNHLRQGYNSDSYESGSGSVHSSDKDFLNSQNSEFSDSRLPRFSQARAEISNAGKSSLLPEIITLKSVKNNLPVGYCCRGCRFTKHVMCTTRKSRNSNKNRAAVLCSFCEASADDTEIFTCANMDSFSCLPCLTRSATFAAPPPCPSDDCDGTCSIRFLPSITSSCYNGHDIPGDTNFWMCDKASCKIKLCFQCCPATAAAPQASLNESSPSSSSCSPNLHPAHNGLGGAPMRPHIGQ